MATIPPSVVDPVAAAIYSHYKRVGDSESQRKYIGASVIGKPCSRALWYDFRWSGRATFDGRLYRLFERGRKEEPWLISDLRAIGVTVYEYDPATGRQFNFVDPDCGGHFGGSCDGLATGVPQAPKSVHVLEFKTSSAKAFATVKKDGIAKSKPEYFAQAQLYMRWTRQIWGANGAEAALFVVVNKDNDDIYSERIKYDAAAADQLVSKALAIIEAKEPPERIGGPDWYECKFCQHHNVCHGNDVPAVSCRTCAHSTPELNGDGRWTCARHQVDLTAKQQRDGCDKHRYIPILLHKLGHPVDATDNGVVYQTPDGNSFINGDKPAGFTSQEIHDMKHKQDIGAIASDAFVQDMRQQFGGTVVA
jgi:hypothetical protein